MSEPNDPFPSVSFRPQAGRGGEAFRIGERVNVLGLVRALSVALAALIFYLLVKVLIAAFWSNNRLDLSAFGRVWHAGGTGTMLLNTLLFIGGSSLIAVVIGSCFAWLNERTNARMGFFGDLIPIIPLLVPMLAGTIGWTILLTPRAGYLNAYLVKLGEWAGLSPDPNGPFNIYSGYGLIFVYVLYLIPYTYLTVSGSLRNLDPQFEEASMMSGSGVLRTLLRVTIPAVRPAVISGGILALMMGLTIYSVPVIIGPPANIDILAVRIVSVMTNHFPADMGSATVLSLFLVGTMVVMFVINGRVIKSGRYSAISGKSGYFSLVSLGRPAKWICRSVIVAYLIVGSLLPLLALGVLSLQAFWRPTISLGEMSVSHYMSAFGNETGSITALSNSVLLGAGGAFAAIAIGLLIGYLRFVCGRTLFTVGGAIGTKAAATVSHIVIAIGFIAGFEGAPFYLHGTLIMLLMAYVVLYLPQASVSAENAVYGIGRGLVEASLMSRASYGRTLVRVILPLSRGGLASGWVFAFVLMAGDVTASFMLATPKTPVVSFVMLHGFTSGNYGTVAVLGVLISVVFICIVSMVLGISKLRVRRRD